MPKRKPSKGQKKGPCGKRNCKCPTVKTQYVLPVTSRTKNRYRQSSRGGHLRISGPSDVASALAAFDLNDQFRKQRKLTLDKPKPTKDSSTQMVIPQNVETGTSPVSPHVAETGTSPSRPAEVFRRVPGMPIRTPASRERSLRRFEHMRAITPHFPTVVASPDIPTPTVTGEREIPMSNPADIAIDIDPSPSEPSNAGYAPLFGLDGQMVGISARPGLMWPSDASPPDIPSTPITPTPSVRPLVSPHGSLPRTRRGSLLSMSELMEPARALFRRDKSTLP